MHNLSAKNDVGVVRANIEEIRVHPDWDPYFSSDFNADLALLVLSENVSFSRTIRPVCLPADSTNPSSETIDLKGTVIGWGLTDANNSGNIQRQASITAVNDTFCYHKDEAVTSFSSNYTFCGGFGNGYPSLGDSGGGYFVRHDKIWVQYGVISATRTNLTGHALPSSIQIYTNLMSFKRWIVSTVNETGGEVGEAMETIKISCDFTYQYKSYYGCIADAVDVHKDNVQIESIIGTHVNDNSNLNVNYLTFLNKSLIYLPHGIGNFFPNLRALQIGAALGMKRVSRSYFKNMTNLQQLQFFENNIDTLEEDSLRDLEKLEVFQLFANKIVELNENFFAKNEKLQLIFIESNRMQTLPKYLFRGKSLLRELHLQNNSLHLIDEQTFETNEQLQYIDLTSNRLHTLPKDLFKSNLLLESLYLGNNLLKTLDEKIFHSNIKLIGVILSFNQLEHLTGNIFDNNLLLQFIYLHNNSIKTIGNEVFGKHLHLQVIDLSINQLELPVGMEPHMSSGSNSTAATEKGLFETNVTIIDSSFNHIEYLPHTLFRNNLILREIFLRNNSIEVVDGDCFKTNSNLTFIDLSSNQLNLLPGKLFQNNLLLRGIDLSSNSLQSIDGNIFDTNAQLVGINLSSNRLEHIPSNLFRNNLALETVLLQSNLLKYIGVDFTRLRNVKQINLLANVCTENCTFKNVYNNRRYIGNAIYMELFQRAINISCAEMK